MLFLRAFFRQCAYALTFFVVVSLIAEFFIPGSVTPFIDPLPLAIIALISLSIDAMRRRADSSRFARLFMAVAVSALLIGIATLSISAGGRSRSIAFIVIAVMIALAGASLLPRNDEQA